MDLNHHGYTMEITQLRHKYLQTISYICKLCLLLLRCAPLLSFDLMQPVVGNSFIQFKVIYGEEDIIANVRSCKERTTFQIYLVSDGAMKELEKVRQTDLNECCEEKLVFAELPSSIKYISERQIVCCKRYTIWFPLKNETVATIVATYRQQRKMDQERRLLCRKVELQAEDKVHSLKSKYVSKWETSISDIETVRDGIHNSNIDTPIKHSLVFQMWKIIEPILTDDKKVGLKKYFAGALCIQFVGRRVLRRPFE